MVLYTYFFSPGQSVFPQKTSRRPKIKAQYCINTSDFITIISTLADFIPKNLAATTNLSEVIQTPEFLSTVWENWLLLNSWLYYIFLMMLKCFSKSLFCQLLRKWPTIWHGFIKVTSEWIWMQSPHEKQHPLDYTENQPQDLPYDA